MLFMGFIDYREVFDSVKISLVVQALTKEGIDETYDITNRYFPKSVLQLWSFIKTVGRCCYPLHGGCMHTDFTP